jgi:hypothetical protein
MKSALVVSERVEWFLRQALLQIIQNLSEDLRVGVMTQGSRL